MSVGRDCGMIDDNDQVIIVNAQIPNTPDGKPTIDFVQTPDISSRRSQRLKQLTAGSYDVIFPLLFLSFNMKWYVY